MLKLTAPGLGASVVIACLALSGTPSGGVAPSARATSTMTAATAARAFLTAARSVAAALTAPCGSDVWAAGVGDDGGLIMRWNGTRWSRYVSPDAHWNGRDWS